MLFYIVLAVFVMRNNRNILECKCEIIVAVLPKILEIIETYWNVNCSQAFHRLPLPVEIIETYWNVNSQGIAFATGSLVEIIETYWNVNLQPFYLSSYLGSRNNRNILECKSWKQNP